MLKSVCLVITGFAAGWLLHAYLLQAPNPDSVFIPDPVAKILKAPDVANPEGPVAQSVVTSVIEPAEDHVSVTESLISAVRRDLVQRAFSSAIDRCLRASSELPESCRNEILGFVDSGHLTPYESAQLLDLWLLEFPDDIDAGTRLVEILINDEQYVPAARRLALLKSYQVEPGKLERVAAEIQAVARAAIIKLTITDDRIGLESLLGILIEMEPGRATWHYSLAKVRYDLQDYTGALNTLSYILFDPDYGDRATALYGEITDKLNLTSFKSVPLMTSGSHFLVRARINGVHDITLLLDTGASLTALDQGVVNRLGISTSKSRDVLLRTAGGVVKANTMKINSMKIGSHTARDLEVASIDLGASTADGLLGMNFLDQFRFIIDQKQRRLLLTQK